MYPHPYSFILFVHAQSQGIGMTMSMCRMYHSRETDIISTEESKIISISCNDIFNLTAIADNIIQNLNTLVSVPEDCHFSHGFFNDYLVLVVHTWFTILLFFVWFTFAVNPVLWLLGINFDQWYFDLVLHR